MPNHFAFVGDPGPDATAMLEVLRGLGLVAKRLEPAEDLVAKLNNDPPATVLFDSHIQGLADIIEEIRDKRNLSSLPLIIRVPIASPELLRDAFRWGVDDFVVDGSPGQFNALMSCIRKADSWKAVRAPAGQVILGHSDRYARMKFARILKRNGYDTFFAGTTEEVGTALEKKQFRAVLVSSELPGEPLANVTEALVSTLGTLPPLVIIAPVDNIESLRKTIPPFLTSHFFEAGADAEGITFVLNEILAPPPVGARRSQRVLYGTPISFVHKGGHLPMNGFTFDINIGGLYIRSLTTLPLQSELEVDFRPPGGRGRVVAEAQVVWRKAFGDTAGKAAPPGMGIQFLDMWPADRAAYETGYAHLLDQAQALTSVVASTPAPPSTPPLQPSVPPK